MELFILSYFLRWKKISFLPALWVSDQIRSVLPCRVTKRPSYRESQLTFKVVTNGTVVNFKLSKNNTWAQRRDNLINKNFYYYVPYNNRAYFLNQYSCYAIILYKKIGDHLVFLHKVKNAISCSTLINLKFSYAGFLTKT